MVADDRLHDTGVSQSTLRRSFISGWRTVNGR